MIARGWRARFVADRRDSLIPVLALASSARQIKPAVKPDDTEGGTWQRVRSRGERAPS